MPKDPAFLFYYQDFIFGTSLMTDEQIGAYIKVLCYLADKGTLCEDKLKQICGTEDKFNAVLEKLSFDGKYYYNERLRKEVEKRKKYTDSRRQNAKAYAQHMENVNEDRDILKEEEEDSKKEKKKYAEYVSLKQDEYENLKKKHGEFFANKMIQVLDNYKGAKGKRYKSDYRAILSWVEEKVKSGPNYAAYITKKRKEDLKRRDESKEYLIPDAEKINKNQ